MSVGAYIVLGSAIAALAALAGTLLQRSWRRRDEVLGAAAAWMAAMDSYILLIGTLPRLPTGQKPVDRWISRFTEKFQEHTGSWAIPVAQAWLFWPINRRLELSTEQLWTSTNRLFLVAPRHLQEELARASDFVGKSAGRVGDPAVLEEWQSTVKPELVRAIERATRSRLRPRRT